MSAGPWAPLPQISTSPPDPTASSSAPAVVSQTTQTVGPPCDRAGGSWREGRFDSWAVKAVRSKVCVAGLAPAQKAEGWEGREREKGKECGKCLKEFLQRPEKSENWVHLTSKNKGITRLKNQS